MKGPVQAFLLHFFGNTSVTVVLGKKKYGSFKYKEGSYTVLRPGFHCKRETVEFT